MLYKKTNMPCRVPIKAQGWILICLLVHCTWMHPDLALTVRRAWRKRDPTCWLMCSLLCLCTKSKHSKVKCCLNINKDYRTAYVYIYKNLTCQTSAGSTLGKSHFDSHPSSARCTTFHYGSLKCFEGWDILSWTLTTSCMSSLQNLTHVQAQHILHHSAYLLVAVALSENLAASLLALSSRILWYWVPYDNTRLPKGTPAVFTIASSLVLLFFYFCTQLLAAGSWKLGAAAAGNVEAGVIGEVKGAVVDDVEAADWHLGCWHQARDIRPCVEVLLLKLDNAH